MRIQAHAHIYAHAYARSIIYMRTQFAQTNGLTTRTRVYIINASNAMPKPYLYTYMHAVDCEQYSQTNANANKCTQTHLRSTRGRFLRANAIAFCALDLKLSGCTIYICDCVNVSLAINNLYTDQFGTCLQFLPGFLP